MNSTEPATSLLRPVAARRHRIALIDGPNMSNLGARSKRMYGPIESLESLHKFVAGWAETLGVELEIFSSNYEGAILEYIHGSAAHTDAYVINPAGLTIHGSATRHALLETQRPYVEVHFANAEGSATSSRGPIFGRAESVFTPTATGVCMGMRQYSYVGALVSLALSLDDVDFLAPTEK
ncbi:type II 3-dehydroquinate dehydratase [Rhodococcoides kyotonense]|uniref:3-dehydroquinate dehydratase n=1 Tax=Rhodococcoides kyotonense TaxID=398843 RepID=A0A239M0Q7_9NOCA|nr:type II 3-dehydroquinate dehydratase [Rhodococcus kyotonensis]SNT36261.1 3-dehydroquinate dehydratase [Rhodococcus kyotonensis]